MNEKSSPVSAAGLKYFPEKSSWCRNEQVCQGWDDRTNELDTALNKNIPLYLLFYSIILLSFFVDLLCSDVAGAKQPVQVPDFLPSRHSRLVPQWRQGSPHTTLRLGHRGDDTRRHGRLRLGEMRIQYSKLRKFRSAISALQKHTYNRIGTYERMYMCRIPYIRIHVHVSKAQYLCFVSYQAKNDVKE